MAAIPDTSPTSPGPGDGDHTVIETAPMHRDFDAGWGPGLLELVRRGRRPVIFLDIDGVLNRTAKAPQVTRLCTPSRRRPALSPCRIAGLQSCRIAL